MFSFINNVWVWSPKLTSMGRYKFYIVKHRMSNDELLSALKMAENDEEYLVCAEIFTEIKLRENKKNEESLLIHRS